MAVTFPPDVATRLATEQLIWLTTVGPDGAPRPALVWYLWTGEEFRIWSRSSAPKVANVRARPAVSLNLNSIRGGGVVTMTGIATLHPDDRADTDARYLDRYRSLITEGLGTTVSEFADDFDMAIRVVPTSLRAW